MIEISDEKMDEATKNQWEHFKRENPKMFGFLKNAQDFDFFKGGYKIGFFTAHKLLTRIHHARTNSGEKLIQSLKKKADLWDDSRDYGHAYASFYGQVAGLLETEIDNETLALMVRKFFKQAKEKTDVKASTDKGTEL
ncbi:hypothetical protein MASR1M48_16940 [Lactococcus petauri]